MKNKIFLLVSIPLNFIFGFISMYVFLWLAIAFYSVNCVINGCSDMVGEEWGGVFGGLLIAGVISAILVPLIIFTSLKFLRLTENGK